MLYLGYMLDDYSDDEVRPNENKTFSYVQVGQMFVGDQELIKIEPKRGIPLNQVERDLARDFKNLRIVERQANSLFITGKAITD